jgi:hypothetical protein
MGREKSLGRLKPMRVAIFCSVNMSTEDTDAGEEESPEVG